jgi:hypothetical protein
MWTQIVGKVRLARMPWQNHTWQVTLYPTATGLTTGRMPYGDDALEIAFDFVRARARHPDESRRPRERFSWCRCRSRSSTLR